ncbi:MAG TPA: histidine phosphatase family protein [Candidatus Ozemobacteraceae bacterium]|nr:histidine phosphatase family protein [Candidatus Ozemobacteraceae bacterium]
MTSGYRNRDDDPVEFVLIRHGETRWNLENRMQGHSDSPLTDKGLRQANAIADRLSREKLDALYSSDLGRAWQTVQPIAIGTGLQPIAAPGWRERNLGIFEGIEAAELPNRYPDEWARFMTWDPVYRMPDGESSEDLRDRIEATANEFGRRHGGMRIGIVTHGGVLDMVMRIALGLPLDQKRSYSLFNASLNSFTWRNGSWRLNTWGDIRHLADAGTGDNESVAAKSL